MRSIRPEAALGAPGRRSGPPLAALARGLTPPSILVAISEVGGRGPTPRREFAVSEPARRDRHTLGASPRPESPHRFCGGGRFLTQRPQRSDAAERARQHTARVRHLRRAEPSDPAAERLAPEGVEVVKARHTRFGHAVGGTKRKLALKPANCPGAGRRHRPQRRFDQRPGLTSA
jgi:hypothetical protein